MTLKAALIQHLKDDAGVAAQVDRRVFVAGGVPQGAPRPLIVVQRIGGTSNPHLGGQGDLEAPMYQVTPWADNQGDLEPVVVAIRAALDITNDLLDDVPSVTVRLQGPPVDGHEVPTDGRGRSRVSAVMTYQIWHSSGDAA